MMRQIWETAGHFHQVLAALALSALLVAMSCTCALALDITVPRTTPLSVNEDTNILADVITSAGYAIDLTQAGTSGDPLTVTIGSGVTVWDDSMSGVYSGVAYTKVINHGTLKGLLYAAEFDRQGSQVDNYGAISGGNTGISALGATFSVINRAGASIIGNRYGVTLYSSGATITNYGTISGNITGIYVGGTGSTISNSGTISGASGSAVEFASGNNTLIVNDGAIFTGGVNYRYTTGNTTTFNTSGSYTLDVKNYTQASNTVDAGDRSVVYSLDGSNNGSINVVQANSVGNSAEVAGDYGHTVALVVDNILSLDIDRSIPSLDFNQPTSSAESGLSGGDEEQPVRILAPGLAVSGDDLYWVRAFGGQRFYDSADTTSSNMGVAMGVDHQFGENRIGLLAGVGGMYNSADDGSNDVDGQVGFGGVYLRHPFADFTLDTELVAGGVYFRSERTVNTTQEAVGHFGGWFVTPAIKVSTDLGLPGDCALTPSLELRYTATSFEGYDESGSSQNISYDERTTQDLEEVLGLKLTHQATFESGNKGSISLSGELVNTSRISGSSSMNASLSGTEFSIETGDQDNVIGGRFGLGGQLGLTDSISLFADAKVGMYSDNSRSWSANAGLKVAF